MTVFLLSFIYLKECVQLWYLKPIYLKFLQLPEFSNSLKRFITLNVSCSSTIWIKVKPYVKRNFYLLGKMLECTGFVESVNNYDSFSLFLTATLECEYYAYRLAHAVAIFGKTCCQSKYSSKVNSIVALSWPVLRLSTYYVITIFRYSFNVTVKNF